MDASGAEGPATVGWNPLDVTVVPDSERAPYVATLKNALPRALFPILCGPSTDALQTRTLIFKALECLVNLNLALPPEMQANIFCVERLLTDADWRNEAISKLPVRLRKWWLADFHNIIGDKGGQAPALRPTLNTLRAWESNERIFAMLGASLSTIRWREIMNNGGIVLMSPYAGEPEASNLLTRLMYHEISTAFRARSHRYKQEDIQPFHLFIDELSASEVLVDVAPDLASEFRKYGAKGYFVTQSLKALPKDCVERLVGNLSHAFTGHPGGDYWPAFSIGCGHPRARRVRLWGQPSRWRPGAVRHQERRP